MAKAKKTKRNVGDLLKVMLTEVQHSYVLVLPSARYAFFDYLGNEELSPEEIVKLKILFQLFVMDNAVTSGRWVIVGHAEPSLPFLQSPPFFKQDAINKTKFWLYLGDGKEVPATREQCSGLERYAVWDPEHVEDRLRDHYAGRPNKWVQSLEIV